jgi:hypothetical protein
MCDGQDTGSLRVPSTHVILCPKRRTQGSPRVPRCAGLARWPAGRSVIPNRCRVP